MVDKSEYYFNLKDFTGSISKPETCIQTTTIEPPFYTSNKYLPSGANKDYKWRKVYENLRSNSKAKSDIKSVLPIGSIVKVDQKISNNLYFDLLQLNKSKNLLARKIISDTSYFPNDKRVENLFVTNIGLENDQTILDFAKNNSIDQAKFKKAFYLYRSILKELEISKYSNLSRYKRRYANIAREINKSINNISGHGLVPVEVLYTDKSIIKQLAKREIRQIGKINMTSLTSSIKPTQRGATGFINANSLDLHAENKYVFRVKNYAPLFTTGVGKNKKQVDFSNKVLKYKISFDEKLQANVYNVEKCCFHDKNKGTLCTFKSYLYDVEDLKGNLTSSNWIDLTPPCCTNINMHYIQPLATDHYKTFLTLIDALKEDERYYYTKSGDPEQQLLLAQNIATKRWSKDYQPNSHLNDDLMKIPLYERETKKYIGLDANKKPVEATAIVRRGPFNSYHYPTHLGEDESNDEWGKPESICAFMQVAKTWRDNYCPGNNDNCNIGFGHIYHPRKLNKHGFHESGECVDIRPFSAKNEKRFQQVDLRDKNSGYNRELTNDLIQLLSKAGGTNIVFNDLSIKNKEKANKKVANHDNHIHVCFKTNNEKVKKTCKDGI